LAICVCKKPTNSLEWVADFLSDMDERKIG